MSVRMPRKSQKTANYAASNVIADAPLPPWIVINAAPGSKVKIVVEPRGDRKSA